MDGQILFFKNASITMSTTIKISAPDKGDIWVSKCLSPRQTSTCNLGNNLNQSIEEGTKLKITVLPTQTAGKEFSFDEQNGIYYKKNGKKINVTLRGMNSAWDFIVSK